MDASDNERRIRKGYEAFNRGDIETLVDLFADDLVWHFPGHSKLAGEHVGRDAVLTFLGAYSAATDGTLRANLHEVMAGETHVAGWATDTASARGMTLDVRAVVIFAMRDGKVIEAWHHFADPDAVDAFLA
jgi:ketosteroid isomerase-like protein